MAFLDELITPFIVEGAPTNQKDFAFGQFFWAAMYYPHQRLEIWRPANVHQQYHIATDFNIKTSPPDAFRRALPYTSPPLATNEEFLALRAKKRPVVLIQPPDESLNEVPKVSMGIKVVRHLSVVAPVFGLTNPEGYSRASEEFLSRVRRLEYPQFCFLAAGGPLTEDSLVRLDEVQSVAIQNLEHTGFSLSPEALAFFRSQVSFFMSGSDGGDFTGYRDLLASE
jgi:hypothetical protein